MSTKIQRRVRSLNPFEQWMVKSNLQYIKAEGLGRVVARLRANGFPQIADGVKAAAPVKEVE